MLDNDVVYCEQEQETKPGNPSVMLLVVDFSTPVVCILLFSRFPSVVPFVVDFSTTVLCRNLFSRCLFCLEHSIRNTIPNASIPSNIGFLHNCGVQIFVPSFSLVGPRCRLLCIYCKPHYTAPDRGYYSCRVLGFDLGRKVELASAGLLQIERAQESNLNRLLG